MTIPHTSFETGILYNCIGHGFHSRHKYITLNTYNLRVVLDCLDLDLELVDLTLIGRMRHSQVVHGEGPEGSVKLWTEIIPDPSGMKGYYSLVHWCHHLLTGRHVFMYLLLLPVAFFCLLQLIILGLYVKRISNFTNKNTLRPSLGLFKGSLLKLHSPRSDGHTLAETERRLHHVECGTGYKGCQWRVLA